LAAPAVRGQYRADGASEFSLRDHLSPELEDGLWTDAHIVERAAHTAFAESTASGCVLHPLANDALELGTIRDELPIGRIHRAPGHIATELSAAGGPRHLQARISSLAS